MKRIKVTYTGDRAAALRYQIAPGGKVFTSQGYLFGARSPVGMLLEEEAKVLANLDAAALDSNGQKMEAVKNRKAVSITNRDLVTVNGKPLPAGDSFEVDLPVVKVKPKAKEAN